MEEKEKAASATETAIKTKSNDKNTKLFCLSIDLDCGEIDIIEVTTPAERVNFGCYIPHHTGTRQQMENLREELIMNRVRKIRRKKIKV